MDNRRINALLDHVRARKAERDKWNPTFTFTLCNGEKIVTDYDGMIQLVFNGTEYTTIETDSEWYAETAALWTAVFGEA